MDGVNYSPRVFDFAILKSGFYRDRSVSTFAVFSVKLIGQKLERPFLVALIRINVT